MEKDSTPTNCDDAQPLLLGSLTGEVIGAFFEVYNWLRWEFLEGVYAGALAVELTDRGVAHRREARLDVLYKGRVAGIYRADFLIDERLVLELKANLVVGEPERRQLLNYLRATGMPLGLLLHFGPEPKVLRVINSYGAHRA
jgi:GxxExxY protein